MDLLSLDVCNILCIFSNFSILVFSLHQFHLHCLLHFELSQSLLSLSDFLELAIDARLSSNDKEVYDYHNEQKCDKNALNDFPCLTCLVHRVIVQLCK